MKSFDVNAIRQQFPVLDQEVHGKPLIYFDNAATAQKPNHVIDTVAKFYQHDNANIHRGIHTLSERATSSYELARDKIAKFINAKHALEVIFTSGTTESINFVAQTFAENHLQAHDEILISEMEHHSNIVPWQMVAKKTGAVIKVIPITDSGEIDLAVYRGCFTHKTKIVAISHISNVLGTIYPIKQFIEIAHDHNVPILIDAAQSSPHIQLDVQDLDCDFLCFSGHKTYGPTGIGILYGKKAWLEKLPPYQGGGSMIKTVTFAESTYADLPQKFEAGTPNIVGAIGLGAAIDFINQIGIDAIAQYEHDLTEYATAIFLEIPDLKIIGTAHDKTSVFSFVMDNIHPHDIGTILNMDGIAVRSGHHCAMPLMQRYQVPATVRASFAFYNTKTEIDTLVIGLNRVREVLG